MVKSAVMVNNHPLAVNVIFHHANIVCCTVHAKVVVELFIAVTIGLNSELAKACELLASTKVGDDIVQFHHVQDNISIFHGTIRLQEIVAVEGFELIIIVVPSRLVTHDPQVGNVAEPVWLTTHHPSVTFPAVKNEPALMV